MKKIFLFIIGVTVALFFTNCSSPGGGGGPSEEWTLSGDVTITEDDGVSADVKMACFYIHAGGMIPDDLLTCVSNIINLGQDTYIPLAFTLNIDASGISPSETDGIILFVWEDTDGDDQYDDIEDWDILLATAACSVFAEDLMANFIYFDSSPIIGWYLLNHDLDFVSIDDATLTGADLVTDWGL
jgi:hypothetical protein